MPARLVILNSSGETEQPDEDLLYFWLRCPYCEGRTVFEASRKETALVCPHCGMALGVAYVEGDEQ